MKVMQAVRSLGQGHDLAAGQAPGVHLEVALGHADQEVKLAESPDLGHPPALDQGHPQDPGQGQDQYLDQGQDLAADPGVAPQQGVEVGHQQGVEVGHHQGQGQPPGHHPDLGPDQAVQLEVEVKGHLQIRTLEVEMIVIEPKNYLPCRH